MSQLWKVTITRDLMVVADDFASAERIAERNEREELFNDPAEIMADEVRELRDIPKEWLDSLPYGSSDDKTCRQILTPPMDGECAG